MEEGYDQNEDIGTEFQYSYLESIEENQINLNNSIDKTNTYLEVLLCFIVFFVLIILLKYAYRLFDMFFK